MMPWLLLAILVVVLIGIVTWPESRRPLVKYVHLLRAFLALEIGVGGFLRLLLFVGLPALAVGLGKGWNERGFDLHLFLVVFLSILVPGILANLIGLSSTARSWLSPGAGRVHRDDRKVGTSAVLREIAFSVARRRTTGKAAGVEEIRSLLTKVLDIVVLHVRDHRGSHDRSTHDTFANLLLERDGELVVVVRDSMQHDSAHARPIPARYPKAALL